MTNGVEKVETATMSTEDSVEQPVSQPATSDSPAARSWTFLTNHAHVLILLHAQGDLVLRDVASQLESRSGLSKRLFKTLWKQVTSRSSE